MKIFVVGSVNMDLVVKAPYVPQSGETIRGDGFMSNAGGKGANQAVAAAKLGGDVYMVGAVGDAFGGELRDSLERYGVKTDYLERIEGVPSGIAVIVVVDGDNRIILDEGANGCADRKLVDRALELAAEGDYLIAQLEIETEVVQYALQRAKEKGMVTVLNPAPASALPEEIFRFCDWFIPNQTEAKFYTGVYPEDEESAKRCAGELARLGVRNVVVTMGEQGSVGIVDGVYRKADCVPVKAVDTTAAGDTYVGALAVTLSEGASVDEAMRFASKASAITVTRRGAQCAIPTREETDRFHTD